MKRAVLINLWFFIFSFTSGAAGQTASFSYHGFLLNTVSGFSAYADCAVDMDGDYLDDVVRIGNKGVYIDYQQSDGSFLQKFYSLPIQSPPAWSICAGDLDNNGYNDLLFANSTSVSFVSANNAGTAYQESVMPVSIFSQRSTIADIDNDGWLDAFVCHDEAQSIPFHNDGSGQLSPDISLIPTADRPGNYAAIWADYDNDGDIDLYITKCLGGAPPGDINRTNLLYRNNADGTFTEVAAEAGLDDNSQSWSTVFEDFDNDGDLDAFIVNHDFQNRLFRNNGDGTFADVTAGSGINGNDLGAWENASGDFNNDGYVDIFSELTQELYLGNGDLTFSGQDAPISPGAIADLNNDGFLDVLKASQLWLNDGNNSNHWLKINPFGLSGNRNGIGARVEIYGDWGVQVREVRSGQSFSPMNSLTVHFGLGPSEVVDSLKINWPSGITTMLEDLKADTTYLVPEADCLLPFTTLSENGEIGLCPGDTLELEAPAGFTQYKWSNGDTTPVTHIWEAGRYFVAVKNAGECTSLSEVIAVRFIEDIPPVIYVEPGSRLCAGETITLSVSHGQNPVWSGGQAGPVISVTETGTYTVSIDALCMQGQLTSAPFETTILPAHVPFVADAIIGAGDSVSITALGENCHWYDQETGGNLLHTGPEFQTPSLASNTVYYVESHHNYPGEILYGGKPDTLGPGGLPSQSGYMLFEAWEPFTLRSVKVYLPPGAPEGVRFIQLFSLDTLLDFRQFDVKTGWNELELDFAVPVGELSLHCPLGNLFRNEGMLDYPYPIGDVGQINSSFFGQQFYYYFYDWKIEKQSFECISPRIPVEVLITDSEERPHSADLRVFPNPASTELFVTMKTPTRKGGLLRLFDLTGKEVLRRSLPQKLSFSIDIQGLNPGIYFLRIDQTADRFDRKIIVK